MKKQRLMNKSELKKEYSAHGEHQNFVTREHELIEKLT